MAVASDTWDQPNETILFAETCLLGQSSNVVFPTKKSRGTKHILKLVLDMIICSNIGSYRRPSLKNHDHWALLGNRWWCWQRRHLSACRQRTEVRRKIWKAIAWSDCQRDWILGEWPTSLWNSAAWFGNHHCIFIPWIQIADFSWEWTVDSIWEFMFECFGCSLNFQDGDGIFFTIFTAGNFPGKVLDLRAVGSASRSLAKSWLGAPQRPWRMTWRMRPQKVSPICNGRSKNGATRPGSRNGMIWCMQKKWLPFWHMLGYQRFKTLRHPLVETVIKMGQWIGRTCQELHGVLVFTNAAVMREDGDCEPFMGHCWLRTTGNEETCAWMEADHHPAGAWNLSQFYAVRRVDIVFFENKKNNWMSPKLDSQIGWGDGESSEVGPGHVLWFELPLDWRNAAEPQVRSRLADPSDARGRHLATGQQNPEAQCRSVQDHHRKLGCFCWDL